MSQSNVHKLFDDLQDLVSEIEGLTKSAVGVAGDQAGEAIDQVQAGLKQTQKRAHHLRNELTRQARYRARKADHYVRENAWTSLVVVAAIGALVGAVLTRRK